jgi:hypothetical protein
MATRIVQPTVPLSAFDSVVERVSALESGGGGGDVLTEEVVVAPTGGQVVVVTHPEVPLDGEGSGRIRFSGLAEVPGGAVYYYFAGPWGDQNLNVNGAAWVQDAGNDGHFSVDPGPQVVAGVRVVFLDEGFAHSIVTINDPDLTASGAVTLNGDMASGPIIRIAGTLGNDNAVNSVAFCDFTGLPMPYSVSRVIVTAENLAGLGTFQELYTWGSEDPTKVRVALSVDDGATWYSHDGTGWGPIALADLRTGGLVPNAAGLQSGFYDSRSKRAELLDADDWHALYLLGVAAGEDFALRVAVGIDPAGGGSSVSIGQLEFRAQEQDTFQPMALATMGAGFTSIKRTSSTTTAFEISLGWAAPPVNWRCQVWTS